MPGSESSTTASSGCLKWVNTPTSHAMFVWLPLILGYILACVTAYFVTEFHRSYGGEEPYGLYAWNIAYINVLSVMCLLPGVNMIAAPVLLTLVCRLRYVQEKLDAKSAIPTLFQAAEAEANS